MGGKYDFLTDGERMLDAAQELLDRTGVRPQSLGIEMEATVRDDNGVSHSKELAQAVQRGVERASSGVPVGIWPDGVDDPILAHVSASERDNGA